MQIEFSRQLKHGDVIELHSPDVPKKGDVIEINNAAYQITGVLWDINPGYANAEVTLVETQLLDVTKELGMP